MVKGLHDLRVVVMNQKMVWAHLRQPPPGRFKANVARGGKIREVAVEKLPVSVKKIVIQIARRFYQEFDNPVYCLDFGMGEKGPRIFELNDQMGFPRTWMKAKNVFLEELVKNFTLRLRGRK